jgi:hypothetical protein
MAGTSRVSGKVHSELDAVQASEENWAAESVEIGLLWLAAGGGGGRRSIEGDMLTHMGTCSCRGKAGLVTRVRWWGSRVQAAAVIASARGGRSRGGRGNPAVKVSRTRTTSRVLVFLDELGPLSWWGAGGLGGSVHRLGPRQRPFLSPATGGRGGSLRG